MKFGKYRFDVMVKNYFSLSTYDIKISQIVILALVSNTYRSTFPLLDFTTITLYSLRPYLTFTMTANKYCNKISKAM